MILVLQRDPVYMVAKGTCHSVRIPGARVKRVNLRENWIYKLYVGTNDNCPLHTGVCVKRVSIERIRL